jgi:DNA polymerase III epsilon subunit-like protein
MLRDEPSIEAVMPKFTAFIDDAEIVSDDLAFDLSFVSQARTL